jgi:hypothetical protein
MEHFVDAGVNVSHQFLTVHFVDARVNMLHQILIEHFVDRSITVIRSIQRSMAVCAQLEAKRLCLFIPCSKPAH